MSKIEYTNIAGEKCLCACTQYEECNTECSLYRRIAGKQTNADRIRAMTDEELAEWIAYNTSCETCPVKSATEYECHNSNCGTAWGLWLKSPVEEVAERT